MTRAVVALLLALSFLFSQGCGWPKKTATPVDWDPHVHEWVFEPTVLVCYTAPVSVADVQDALDEWARHGAPQLQAYADPCYRKHGTAGLVYVDLPTWEVAGSEDWGADTVGLTTVYSLRKAGKIFAGDIHLMSDDKRVLQHEVGHLWFGDHYPTKGHVMAEWVEDYEESFRGVRKAFRAED